MTKLLQLKTAADEAEKRHRMAARRVKWLENLLYQSETGEQFTARNTELEQAIATAQLYGMEALKARSEYATADIQARW